MIKIRQINLIVFMIFVIASTSLMYILGIDFFGKQEKPWHLQPSLPEDSLSQIYREQYLILDKTRLLDTWSDSTQRTVVILIDAWGVPTEESLMQKDFSHFTDIPHKFAIHQRLANRTKHAELVEFRNNYITSIYIFGGDSLEYGRTEYIPSLGFKEALFCQKCNDSTVVITLDSLINTHSHNLIAWTTQDAKTGEPTMRTYRHRRAQATRRPLQERVEPYSAETTEALTALIGELAAMPPDVLLLFQSILKGESLRKIAESRSQSEAETRAAIAEAVRDWPTVADVWEANAPAIEAATEGRTGHA